MDMSEANYFNEAVACIREAMRQSTEDGVKSQLEGALSCLEEVKMTYGIDD